MVITNLEIEGYGKLKNISINFNSGSNMIYGTNESGKSTIIRCLLSLLYGQKSTAPGELDEKEEMKPWNGAPYRASLRYESGTGEKFRVTRDFESGSVQIIDENTDKDITDSFEKDDQNEPMFARKHLGLEKKGFISTVLMSQGQVDKLQDARGLSSKIMALADTATEESTYLDAISRLEKLLQEIGDEDDPESELSKIQETINLYMTSSREIEKDRKDKIKLQIELASAGDDLENYEKELKKLIYFLNRKEIEKCISIIEKTEAIESEIPQIKEKLDKIKDIDSVSMEGRTTLYSLQVELKSARNKLEEMEQKRIEMMSDYQKVKSQLDEKSRLLNLEDNIQDLLDLSGKTDEARSAVIESKRKMLQDGRNKIDDIKRDFQEEEGKFTGFKCADEYDEKISDLESKVAKKDVLKLKEADQKRLEQEMVRLKGMTRSRLLTAIFLMLCGGVIGVFSFFQKISLQDFSLTSNNVLFSVGVAIVVGGFIFWLTGKSNKREIGITEQNILVKKDEIKKLKEEVASAQIALKELFVRIGALSVDELRKRYREFNRIKIDMETTVNLVKTLEKELNSLTEDYNQSPQLRELFINLGYTTEDEKITGQIIERFQNDYNGAKALENRSNEMRKEYEVFLDERKKPEVKIGELEEKINEVLAIGEVGSTEEYDEALKISQESDKLVARLDSLEEKKMLIIGDKTIDYYKEKTNKLNKVINNLIEQDQELMDEDPGDRDTDKIAEGIEAIQPRLIELKSRISTIEAKIEEMNEKVSKNELVEEIDEIRKKKEELLKHKEAIEISINTIHEVGKKFHEQIFAPQLSKSISGLVHKITKKYDSIDIDENLNLIVKIPETGELVSVDNLSKGTIDQLYFALRVGIIKLLSGERFVLPMIMDDPFLQFDEVRRKSAFEAMIDEIEPERQLILHTGSQKQKQEFARMMRDRKRIARLTHIGEMELIKPDPVMSD
ncbi:MAG: AAA family ATPase [Candidatus Eremiobacteraeota bacterium]|nr:AAA family ATPase [Candidatus Eremiobacteraeota bacterium]